MFMDSLLLTCVVRAAHKIVYQTPFYYDYTQIEQYASMLQCLI